MRLALYGGLGISRALELGDLARPLFLDALLVILDWDPIINRMKDVITPDLAPAKRRLRELEYFWPDACIVASLIVFVTAVCAHSELLMHKVLLLLLAVPEPEFDRLACHAKPSERIPTWSEGRHSTDLLFHGHVVHAYCGHLVTGCCRVDI